MIEYFTKKLSDYLDGLYDVDEDIQCSDWCDECIMPECLGILLSDEPVEKMVDEHYEKILEDHISNDLRLARIRSILEEK